MAPARTRAAVHAASETSRETVAVDEWDAERASSTAAAHVKDHLNQLADDELLRVVGHLSVTDLGRLAQVCKHCMELATCDLSWVLHVQELLSGCKIDLNDFEGNFLECDPPRLPKYDGPPLRMPYLTPITRNCVWDPRHRKNTASRQISDDGLQYRCCPSSILNPEIDDLVWITRSFPVTCCGAQHATRPDFEEHILDMRHYERMMEEQGEGRLPDICVDPRLHRPNTFEALGKREQYLRMRRYVDAILPRIKARCDPASWSVTDKAGLQALSSQGLSCMQDVVDETDDVHKDDYFYELLERCRLECQPNAIGSYICGRVLQSFECLGVYVEVEAVPYFSVRDFLTRGLAACDPDGGSSSGAQWWSGLSEFFDSHYRGTYN